MKKRRSLYKKKGMWKQAQKLLNQSRRAERPNAGDVEATIMESETSELLNGLRGIAMDSMGYH